MSSIAYSSGIDRGATRVVLRALRARPTGEEIASGIITADMSGVEVSWFRIQIGQLDHWIILVPRFDFADRFHSAVRLVAAVLPLRTVTTFRHHGFSPLAPFSWLDG
jgi:hypothetical protein